MGNRRLAGLRNRNCVSVGSGGHYFVYVPAMTAYYNEYDPKAAAWLRELIKQGHIADGVVDDRSIEDVTPADLKDFTQCHFFAGIGVWSYALRRAGWSDDRPVWTGSCPCQPFSAAGKGAGFADERHLWPAFHHLISQCRPDIVFGEQVASKDGLGWLDLVHADLEATGYASGAVDLCAAGVGAPHIRQRLWWVAERLGDANGAGPERHGEFIRLNGKAGWQAAGRCVAPRAMASSFWAQARRERGGDGAVRLMPPIDGSLAHGSAARVGRLRGYGNAIVAPAAQAFIESVMETME